MTKPIFTAAALLIALAAPQADAACETADLSGRWSAYSEGSLEDAFYQRCTLQITKAGKFRSGSRCRGLEVGLPPVGGQASTVETEGLRVSRSCLISGVVEYTFEEGVVSCTLDATLASDKQTASGFVRCTTPLLPYSTGSLFNMVRR